MRFDLALALALVGVVVLFEREHGAPRPLLGGDVPSVPCFAVDYAGNA